MRKVFEPEVTEYTDRKTGRLIRQLTNAHCINHHPFFLIPAYDRQMRWLFFVSHRLGAPQLFAVERDSMRLVQLTEVEHLIEWSVHPDLSGKYVYFTTAEGGWRLELSTQKIEQLFAFGTEKATGAGMVAGGMGTTALSPSGRYWAVPFHTADGSRIMVYDTVLNMLTKVTDHDMIAHMQFCPDDDTLLFFAGNFTSRIWTIRIDGTEKRQHGRREKGQWITHESWLAGRREIMYVDWPHAVRAISIDSGSVRTLISFHAWHPISNVAGTRIIADTNCPDSGIITFNVTPPAHMEVLCMPDSSNAGEHWKGPFPYENGPVFVYAPQHTHPHPRFSFDDKFVVFTSDKTGFAQVYEVPC